MKSPFKKEEVLSEFVLPREEEPSATRVWRNFKRKVKQYRLNRRRARNTRKKMPGRRVALVLTFILLMLFGAFAWALRYVQPTSEGIEVSIDQLAALADEDRISTATFLDEDNRLVGRFTAPVFEPQTEEPPKKPGDDQTQAGKRAGAKAEGGEKTANGKDSKSKKGRTKPEPEAQEVSIAPPWAGTYWLTYPSSDAAFGALSDLVTRAGARVAVDPQNDKQAVRILYTYLLPLLILGSFFGLLFASGRGGGGGIGDVMTFGQIGKKRQRKGRLAPVGFGDVGGAEEAVAELSEVVDYLSNPERYDEIGAVPPKGVLLFGPPGCGKTLLAKAVAGEAGVPFFSVAGAEFVESLVGIGAARVRDLFQRVRAVAPAIVFIDELDAAGRKRGYGDSAGGSDEREQTLNQLLVELDGFEVSTGIVVIGATNRPDILDPALLRPGRFDRHITVDAPDAEGRKEILELHARGKTLAPDADLKLLADRTSGFSGADLANVLNEAALLTLREGKDEIEMPELEEAVERVMHGPKKRGRVLSQEERRRAAYHESGHALLAAATGDGDAVHRVTILARGRGIGLSSMQRETESVLLTRTQLWGRLVTAMAGMAAEELVFGEPSTGPEQDIEQATEMARNMVGRYGFSPVMGRTRLLASDIDQFLGAGSGISELGVETHERMDAEIRRLLDEAEKEATRILTANQAALDEMAARLVADELLEGAALEAMLGRVDPAANPLSVPFTTPSTNGNGPHAKGAGRPGSRTRRAAD